MQLAQLNIATAKYQMDAPEIQYFVESLGRINLLAEQSPKRKAKPPKKSKAPKRSDLK